MAKIIGVRFRNAGKLTFFETGACFPTPGDSVVVETSQGIKLGECVTDMQELSDESEGANELHRVLRIANNDDLARDQANRVKEEEALQIAKERIAAHKLDMKLISVEYTLDGGRVLFYFSAKERVDFRSLVKDLGALFHTRIELRQINAREEAKLIGGIGPCGRPVCCGQFLGECPQVAFKTLKGQNLTNNPKLNGVCGRLMCCLRFEEEYYDTTRKRMPPVGREIETPDGRGVVHELNIIRETVRVRISKGEGFEIKEYPLEVLMPLNQTENRRDRAAAEPAEAALETARPASNERQGDENSAAAESAEQESRRERARAREREKVKAIKQPVRRKANQAKPAEQKSAPTASRSQEKASQPQPAATSNSVKKDTWRSALERAKKDAEKQDK